VETTLGIPNTLRELGILQQRVGGVATAIEAYASIPSNFHDLAASSTAMLAMSIRVVPEVTAGDFVRLLETPTRETVNYWILRGERSVWPAVAALRIRCAVENELDRSYQVVRKLKAGGLRRKGSMATTAGGDER
jgi:hypothetical protein